MIASRAPTDLVSRSGSRRKSFVPVACPILIAMLIAITNHPPIQKWNILKKFREKDANGRFTLIAPAEDRLRTWSFRVQ